jgi:hypothetical protein
MKLFPLSNRKFLAIFANKNVIMKFINSNAVKIAATFYAATNQNGLNACLYDRFDNYTKREVRQML